jgi:hypothetical protein
VVTARSTSNSSLFKSISHITTDDQSIHRGFEPTLGLVARYCFLSGRLSEDCCLVFVGPPLWRQVGSVFCQSQPVVIYQNVHLIFTLHEFHTAMYMKHIQGIFQYRYSTARDSNITVGSGVFYAVRGEKLRDSRQQERALVWRVRNRHCCGPLASNDLLCATVQWFVGYVDPWNGYSYL